METRIKKIVEELLKEESKCRNNDKWLIIRVLQKLGLKFWINYKDLDKIPAFESITRCRRQIQNQENKYNNFVPEPGQTFEKPIESYHKS